MKLSTLTSRLDTLMPKTLSEEWDNDGDMLAPNGDKEIERVLVALDVTPECVEEAIAVGADLIVSHHPFIFKPLKNLSECNKTDLVTRLIKADISVVSYHTRFDACVGGMNDALAARLGIIDPEPLESMARIGELDDTYSPEELAAYVAEALDTNVVLYSAGRPVKRLAVLGGGGKDLVAPARLAGADAIVTGDIPHGVVTSEIPEGITVVDAGHYGTEKIFVEAIVPMLTRSGLDESQIVLFRGTDPRVFVMKESVNGI